MQVLGPAVVVLHPEVAVGRDLAHGVGGLALDHDHRRLPGRHLGHEGLDQHVAVAAGVGEGGVGTRRAAGEAVGADGADRDGGLDHRLGPLPVGQEGVDGHRRPGRDERGGHDGHPALGEVDEIGLVAVPGDDRGRVPQVADRVDVVGPGQELPMTGGVVPGAPDPGGPVAGPVHAGVVPRHPVRHDTRGPQGLVEHGTVGVVGPRLGLQAQRHQRQAAGSHRRSLTAPTRALAPVSTLPGAAGGGVRRCGRPRR